jgi:hypothetical protein
MTDAFSRRCNSPHSFSESEPAFKAQRQMEFRARSKGMSLRERAIPAVSGSLKIHSCKDSDSITVGLYSLHAMAK